MLTPDTTALLLWLVPLLAATGLVARTLAASPVLAVTAGVGTVALLFALASIPRLRDADALRAACAAMTLVLAALHARALAPATSFHALHLGLAAAVASSSVVTLTLHRSSGHALATLAVCLPIALFVVLSGGPSFAHVAVGLAAALFAWVRPLGALGAALQAVALHHGPVDPGLFWNAVPALAPPRASKEVIRPCP